MRYFFACSIGFTIPVEDFGNIVVWKRALLLLSCIVGKIGMGLFALPLTLNEFMILGFAWGSWGEFSFIIALNALRGGLLTGDSEYFVDLGSWTEERTIVRWFWQPLATL